MTYTNTKHLLRNRFSRQNKRQTRLVLKINNVSESCQSLLSYNCNEAHWPIDGRQWLLHRCLVLAHKESTLSKFAAPRWDFQDPPSLLPEWFWDFHFSSKAAWSWRRPCIFLIVRSCFCRLWKWAQLLRQDGSSPHSRLPRASTLPTVSLSSVAQTWP